MRRKMSLSALYRKKPEKKIGIARSNVSARPAQVIEQTKSQFGLSDSEIKSIPADKANYVNELLRRNVSAGFFIKNIVDFG